MIVKMKKLTLLCTHAQREKTLQVLRDLAVVHVKHIQAPEGTELEQARNHLLYVQRAQEVLGTRPAGGPNGKEPDKIVDAVWRLIHREKELKDALQGLEHEKARIQPFGDFDPRSIHRLAEAGVFVKLYELPAKALPKTPEGVAVAELGRNKNSIYAAAFGRAPFALEAHEVRLPDQSLSQIEHHLERTRTALSENEEEFRQYAGDRQLVEQIAGEAADGVAFLEVLSGMGGEESFTYLQGFYPADREADIVQAARENGWGYKMEEVAPADAPPTLLRNPKWVAPIKAVLGMIGVVPGYRELDVSALFLIFLSIFFAFLIGDAGYGALFIGLTLYFKKKLRHLPQNGFNLLLIMSACTVAWGMLTGTYFGISFSALPGPLKALSSHWLTAGGNSDIADSRVMLVCFTIGAVHLSIAHLWNLVRKINSLACLADVGWLLCTWMLYFVVLNMVLDIPYPLDQSVLWGTVGAGVLLNIASLVAAREYIGLITLVLNVVSNFVDIISYVRLFAVGAASFAIANAFNEMAVQALGEKGVLVGGAIAAFTLFLGHALNIVLGAMAIMVHGIRLNTLEFSGHAGVQWAGTAFNPFRKKCEHASLDQ